MTGAWGVLRARRPLAPRAAPRVARAAHATATRSCSSTARCSSCMTESRTRFDRRLAAPRARHPRRRVRRRRASCAGCARTTPRARSATRCSTSARSPGIGNLWKAEGCWEAADRPVAPHRRGLRRGGAGDRRARARPRMQRVGRATATRTATSASTAAPAGRARAAATRDPRARPGRRQPHDLLVPGMSALRRVGHKGADLIAPGNTPRVVRRRAGGRRRHDRVRRPARAPRRPRRGRCSSPTTTRTRGAATRRRSTRASTHLASRGVRGRRARRRPQAPRLRGARRRRAARARPRRALARVLAVPAQPRPRPRARARAAARLVGPARATDYTDARGCTLLPALAALAGLRAPPARRARAPATSATGRVDALMAHWRLVTPRLVEAVRDGGRRALRLDGDDAERIRRLEATRRDAGDHQRPAAVRRDRIEEPRILRSVRAGRPAPAAVVGSGSLELLAGGLVGQLGPEEGGELAGDGDGHDGRALAAFGELAMACVEADLGLPGAIGRWRAGRGAARVGGGSARRLRSAAGGRGGCRPW